MLSVRRACPHEKDAPGSPLPIHLIIAARFEGEEGSGDEGSGEEGGEEGYEGSGESGEEGEEGEEEVSD